MCECAPGLLIEKERLSHIGDDLFLGCVGDASHSYGYHLCNPQADDYSSHGKQNDPVGDFACAIDISMAWEESRDWLNWLIEEIREDRIKGIAEVIGSFDGENVRYWSDTETPQWEQEGTPYYGEGHDTWTHVAIYRSTANDDHRILAGWEDSGGGEDDMSDDYGPYGKPEEVEDRTIAVMIADLWGQEREGVSPYDGALTYRSEQLDRIEQKLDTLLNTAKK